MADFQTTPLALDPYARYFVDIFDEREIISVPTGFQTFFGVPGNAGKTLWSPNAAVVDIDIVRGNEKRAALIPRGGNVETLSLENTTQTRFVTQSRVYPLAEEIGNIDSNQHLFRRAGENPFSGMTQLERMRIDALEIHKEHVRRILRLDEYLAAQAILTGTMPAILGTADTDLIFDFQRNSDHDITVATPWDNAASNPIGDDIDPACALLRANGHVKADMMILGSGAASAFVQHAAVQALADNRRFELVNIGGTPVPPQMARFVEAGFIFRGRLVTPAGNELYIFSYLDVYTDSSDNPQLYMPTGEALICSSRARCDRYYGPAERIPNLPSRDQLYNDVFGFAPGMEPRPPNLRAPGGVIVPEAFYFDAYVSENQKRITCRTQHAPIFAPIQADAFAKLDGLLT